MFNAQQNADEVKAEAQGPSNLKIVVIAGLTTIALDIAGYAGKAVFNYVASKFKK